MKILQINNYHYYRGGSETVYLNTGKLLEKHGHQVAYFSSKSEFNIPSEFENYFTEQIDINNPSIYEKTKNLKKFICNGSSANSLEKLLEKFKPDVAHLHIFYGILSSSILKTLRKHKIPILMSIHEYRLLCPVYTHINGKGEICEKCVPNKYINCFTNKCCKESYLTSLAVLLECNIRDLFFNHLRYIDKFIMVSEFIMNKHIIANKKFKAKSIRIYNFIEDRKINTFEKKDDFVYFGRLSPEKGILTLLKAFKEIPDYNLKIIGIGSQFEEIENFIKTFSINNVKLLGYKTGEELTREIMTSKFSIIPSEWYENNPMSLIESLALGIPVVGANIGGIPELVNHSTGFLFESRSMLSLKNTLENAINLTKDEYENLSKSAIEFSKKYFSKDEHYKKLVETYTDVIFNYQE